VGWFYIDAIARKGVEIAGTYALGVPTTLDKADVAIFHGHVELDGLRVADPKGFDSPYFMQAPQLVVDVSLGSLRSDRVVVPLLHIDGLAVVMEKRNSVANYQVIMDNLKNLESKSPQQQQPAKQGKKFIIHKVEITNVTAHVDMVPAVGKALSLDLKLDPIVLQNVGSESSHGVDATQLVDILTKAVLLAVANKAGDAAGALAGDLSKGLGQLSSLSANGVDALGNLGARTGQQITQGEGLGQIGKGLGNLFGGGENSASNQHPK
jgi:hypothetical protein